MLWIYGVFMMSMLWNAAATVLFLACFLALAMRWLSFCGVGGLPAALSAPLPARTGSVPGRRTRLGVFAAALLFRAALAVGSLLLYRALEGPVQGGLAGLPELWTRWDAVHYLKLAELGYGGYWEDGQPLFLVFYPLYVWLVRAMGLLIPNTAAAGMAVSWLCFAGGCVYLYCLICEEYGASIARRTMLLLCAFPFSFFFGGILTESLFLLTTAAALYHIRRHAWGRYALWGVLAAMTRMMGLILIGAAIAEFCVKEKPFTPGGRGRLPVLLSRLPLLCAPVLGSLIYLALNFYVAGDPFAFTVMQRHWSQGFAWFPSVLAYLARYAASWPTVSTRWEMWIPELALFPCFAALLLKSWKRHRSMYTLYAFVYFILNYCLSWLLSAGRYLSCALPCFLFAADCLEERPKSTAALAAGMALCQCFFLWRYLAWGQVM